MSRQTLRRWASRGALLAACALPLGYGEKMLPCVSRDSEAASERFGISAEGRELSFVYETTVTDAYLSNTEDTGWPPFYTQITLSFEEAIPMEASDSATSGGDVDTGEAEDSTAAPEGGDSDSITAPLEVFDLEVYRNDVLVEEERFSLEPTHRITGISGGDCGDSSESPPCIDTFRLSLSLVEAHGRHLAVRTRAESSLWSCGEDEEALEIGSIEVKLLEAAVAVEQGG